MNIIFNFNRVKELLAFGGDSAGLCSILQFTSCIGNLSLRGNGRIISVKGLFVFSNCVPGSDCVRILGRDSVTGNSDPGSVPSRATAEGSGGGGGGEGVVE